MERPKIILFLVVEKRPLNVFTVSFAFLRTVLNFRLYQNYETSLCLHLKLV